MKPLIQLLFVTLVTLSLTACNPPKSHPDNGGITGQLTMKQHCNKMGGQLERDGVSLATPTYCVFSDRTGCDAIALMRGECGLKKQCPTPRMQAINCERGQDSFIIEADGCNRKVTCTFPVK